MTATARCHPRRPSFDGFATGPCYECYLAQRGITPDQELDELWGPPQPVPPHPLQVAVPRVAVVAPVLVSDYERQVVTCALLWPELVEGCGLEAAHFTDKTMQTIWAAVLRVDHRDAVAIGCELQATIGLCGNNELDDIGGPYTLIDLIDTVPVAKVNFPYYVKRVLP